MNHQILSRVTRRALSTSARRFSAQPPFSGGPEKAPSSGSPTKGGPDNIPGSQNAKADSVKATNNKTQSMVIGMGVVAAGYLGYIMTVGKKREAEHAAGNVPAWESQLKTANTK